MLDTIKKMVLNKNKKDSNLDKPRKSDDIQGRPHDDYHIPEPEDIRRLPSPSIQNMPRDDYSRRQPMEPNYPREPQRNREYQYPEPQRMNPERRMPQTRPDINETIRDILYRIDNIERRVSRLERYGPQPGPQPVRY